MFGWDFDELALLVGGGYLALRVLGGLALVFWRFIADSALAFHIRPWTPLLTSAAVGLVAVGSLSSVVGGGLPPNIRAVAYFATFFGGLMLGSTFDLFLTFQLHRLSDCLDGPACSEVSRATPAWRGTGTPRSGQSADRARRFGPSRAAGIARSLLGSINGIVPRPSMPFWWEFPTLPMTTRSAKGSPCPTH